MYWEGCVEVLSVVQRVHSMWCIGSRGRVLVGLKLTAITCQPASSPSLTFLRRSSYLPACLPANHAPKLERKLGSALAKVLTPDNGMMVGLFTEQNIRSVSSSNPSSPAGIFSKAAFHHVSDHLKPLTLADVETIIYQETLLLQHIAPSPPLQPRQPAQTPPSSSTSKQRLSL